MKVDEKRVARLMKSLSCTREEALAVIAEDEEIDGMSMKELHADETPEQKKARKEATKTGTRKRTEVKRERKVDETKKHLLDAFRIYLEGSGAVVEPLKTEAEMNFKFEGADYTVKLIKHRPPKT